MSHFCQLRRQDYTNQSPLDEAHLVAARGLTHQEVSTKCVNKRRSSERRYFVRQSLTDLLYANAKDLIQSGRI